MTLTEEELSKILDRWFRDYPAIVMARDEILYAYRQDIEEAVRAEIEYVRSVTTDPFLHRVLDKRLAQLQTKPQES